jgi:hypothetical protein
MRAGLLSLLCVLLVDACGTHPAGSVVATTTPSLNLTTTAQRSTTTAPATALPASQTPSPVGASSPTGRRIVTRSDGGHTITFQIGETFEVQAANPIIAVQFRTPGIVAPLGDRTPGSADPWLFVAQATGSTDLAVDERFPVPPCAKNNPPCNPMPPPQLVVHVVVRATGA